MSKGVAEVYNYFRDYDPSIGRYVESDPIGLRGGINTYGYVSAKPLSRIDPDGRAEQHVPGWGDAPIGVPDVSEEARQRLAQQFTDLLRQWRDKLTCPPNTSCDPPAGTRCYLGPHMPGLGEKPHGSFDDWHYHIYEMQQFGGTCQWRRVSDRRGGTVGGDGPPEGLSYCQTYPSFVKQMPEKY